MSIGGNQRDLARAKAQKKQQELAKGKRSESGASIAKRKEADAEALRLKQAVSVSDPYGSGQSANADLASTSQAKEAAKATPGGGTK